MSQEVLSDLFGSSSVMVEKSESRLTRGAIVGPASLPTETGSL